MTVTTPIPCRAPERQRLAATCRALVALPAASLLLAAGARAQSAACEEFKNKLASRVDASISAFTLEVVPGKAPVPPDAKVFGTCDGGAYKILFRRGGSTRPVPAAAAAAPAPAPQASEAPPKPAPAPASAPKPAPVLPPVMRVVPPASAVASAPAPMPAPPPAKPVAASASPVAAPRPVAAPPPPPSLPTRPVVGVQPAEAAIATAEPAVVEETGFLARNWRWLCALLLLPVAGGLWAWRAHSNAYDEAGLPRGPRL